jgi:hypothetical protein
MIMTKPEAVTFLNSLVAQPVNMDYYSCNEQYCHSPGILFNMKAYAVWWLLANISGWGSENPWVMIYG